MKHPTALFQDVYFGSTEMSLTAFRTTRQGAKVTRFRWTPVGAQGCITTGFLPSGFSTLTRGIEAAKRHARFSQIEA